MTLAPLVDRATIRRAPVFCRTCEGKGRLVSLTIVNEPTESACRFCGGTGLSACTVCNANTDVFDVQGDGYACRQCVDSVAWNCRLCGEVKATLVFDIGAEVRCASCLEAVSKCGPRLGLKGGE